jgi:hypothetical protein
MTNNGLIGNRISTLMGNWQFCNSTFGNTFNIINLLCENFGPPLMTQTGLRGNQPFFL